MVMGPRSVYRVTTSLDWIVHAKDFLARNGKPPILVERVEQPPAFISAGRWVVKCLFPCSGGMMASPEWNLAICYECGSLFRPIFPENWKEIESVISQRPTADVMNYFPDPVIAFEYGVAKLDESGSGLRGETIDDLIRENEEHKEVSIQNRMAAFEHKLRYGA